MTRFADQIRDDGIDVDASLGAALVNRYEAQFVEDVLRAEPIVFDVSVVAQAVADGMAVPANPPAMRPPYDLLWVEYVVPEAGGPQRVGAFVHTRSWDERTKAWGITRPPIEPYQETATDQVTLARMRAKLATARPERILTQKQANQARRDMRRLTAVIHGLRATAKEMDTRRDDLDAEIEAVRADDAAIERLAASATEEPKWIVSMHGYARINGRNVVGFGRWHWALNEHGDPVASAHVSQPMTPWFKVITLAMSLTNCGNVDQDTQHPSAKVQRARERRNKLPLVSYRTLVIRPMSRSGSTGPVDRSDQATRLHLRRGGFRDYRANGLFGREYLRRVFWFSPTLVGRDDVGRVEKDYAVEAV